MSLISVNKAITLLKSKDVVALPTETVYGLAAIIDSEESLKKIFAVKNRPFFDPLIVHVQDLKQAQHWGHWDAISAQLAQAFWPGPLTLVVPRKPNILSLITSGGETVAFRSPSHPVFQEVLKNLTAPLAAPSANRFGHTSPTCAEHVLSEFKHQVPVVDGGLCEKGIESTVLQYKPNENKIAILRPGLITLADIKSALSENSSIDVVYEQQENSPGHLKNHYQPEFPLVITRSWLHSQAPQQLISILKHQFNQEVLYWTLSEDPRLAARELYIQLRRHSKKNHLSLLNISQPNIESPTWKALWDRVYKASTYQATQVGDAWQVVKKQ